MNQKETTQNYLKQNLRYLLVLRAIAIGTQILALLFMLFAFDLPVPVIPISILIVFLILFTVYSWWHLAKIKVINNKDYMLQLIVDIFVLSLLVYLTGGSSNPFTFFFLLPITFAAASLRFKHACIIAALAAVSYTLLMFYHVPLLKHSDHHAGFDLHIWGMWYGFLVSATLVTYYVSRIGATVRKRNQALAIAREENLKSDQVLALGTLAAGTAHELGTPLSTMAVLTKELEHDYQSEPETLKSLQLLRQQIDRCKRILSKMAIDAGTVSAESGRAINLKEYLEELYSDWKTLRYDLELESDIQLTGPELKIIADTTVSQSIMNVLNNAAEAAMNKTNFIAEWNNDWLKIYIKDDGEGIEPALIKTQQPRISTKQPQGMGIGLFLAQVTLNRVGGNLQIKESNEQGTTILIELPLQQFIAG